MDIVWGNSSHSENIFKFQKRIIGIIMGAKPRDSCRELFKILKILSLTCPYIFGGGGGGGLYFDGCTP
jgi:hypothetical protein